MASPSQGSLNTIILNLKSKLIHLNIFFCIMLQYSYSFYYRKYYIFHTTDKNISQKLS